MTIGAPSIDVTVLIFSSTGASAIRAIRSQIIQNTAPIKNVPGITTIGVDVPNAYLVRNGTAIPTKEMGPANAVTHAERILDSNIITTRNTLIFTPILCAYASPS